MKGRFYRLVTFKRPAVVSQGHYLEYVAIQVASVFALIVSLLLVALFYHFAIYPMAAISCISVWLWGWAIKANVSAQHVKAVVLACVELCGHAVAAVYFLGLEFGFQYYLWPTACLAVINSRLKVNGAALTGLACILLFLLLNVAFPGVRYSGALSDWALYLYASNILAAAAPLIMAVMLVRRQFERQRRDLVEMATRDELTQLYNRRYLRDFLQPRQAQARRTGETSVVALGDIDNFKPINDDFGHDVGDEVLRQVARFLLDSVREEDLVCRWGGEEFVIVFANTRLADARVILQRLHQAMPQQGFLADRRAVTISFGVTELKATESLDDALARADDLLYQAKAAGRNRIEVAPEGAV